MDQSDGFAASLWIVRQAARRSGFSGVKAYMLYVELLKKRCNNAGRTFCDAIMFCHFYHGHGGGLPAAGRVLTRLLLVLSLNRFP